MAVPTLVTQLREATVTNAVAKFEITTTVTDRGDLPDKGAFVFEIIDEDDPKQDELLRIADVGDLTEYRIDRSVAVFRGERYWREATYTVSYSNIQAAIDAKDFIQEEINQLATDWQDYITKFRSYVTTPAPENLAFPQADIGVLAPLIATYEETVELRKQQEEDIEDKTTECNDLQTEITEIQSQVDQADVSLTALNSSKASLNAALSAMIAIDSAGDSLTAEAKVAIDEYAVQKLAGEVTATGQTALDPILFSGGTLPLERTAFSTALSDLAQAIADTTEAINSVDTQIALVTAQLDETTGLKADLNDKIAEKATCDAELVSLQAVLDEYERQEQDQLNTIVALCPTYEGV